MNKKKLPLSKPITLPFRFLLAPLTVPPLTVPPFSWSTSVSDIQFVDEEIKNLKIITIDPKVRPGAVDIVRWVFQIEIFIYMHFFFFSPDKQLKAHLKLKSDVKSIFLLSFIFLDIGWN